MASISSSSFSAFLLLVFLACANAVTAQLVSPLNSSLNQYYPTGDDQLQLSPPGGYPGSQTNPIRINLVNLTTAGVSQLSESRGQNLVIEDAINFTPPNSTYSANTFNSGDIIVLPCDPSDGYSPVQAVRDAVSRSVIAIVLYSSTQAYCTLIPGGDVSSNYVIYSTTDVTAWTVINDLNTQTNRFSNGPWNAQWYIGRKAVLDNITMSDNNGGPRFGPGNGSPSTAVAMIILYSITGVITALFLIIIITGAIRAHRHPERYGPRNDLGRPRQSRAKGLARAMLETIPIVKFGEKEEDRAKPGDVELANAKSTESVVGDDANGRMAAATIAAKDTSNPTAQDNGDRSNAQEISTAATARTPVEEEALGCSICTEDFERGQDVRVLPCNHSYHPACIDPWLLNVSGTCPLCRIDLRPPKDQDPNSNGAVADGTLPPPLDAAGAEATGLGVQNHRSSRRLSGFITDILNPHRMQAASREERIEALRRLREQRRQSTTDEAETRRRRRLTARLGETFGVRTRRGSSPPAPSTSAASNLPDTQAGAARSMAEESIPEERATQTIATSTSHPR